MSPASKISFVGGENILLKFQQLEIICCQVTYCGGAEDKCITDMIVTVANVSMPAPGVVHHDYTDAPLSPQVLVLTLTNQKSVLYPSWPILAQYLSLIDQS